jgi:Outer membrane protein beta-barrel domain
MNRTLIAAAAALLSMSGVAQAAPYAGIDLNASLLNLNPSDSSDYPQSTVGPQIHAGYRFDRANLAVELGYSTSRGEQDPDNLRLNMLTVDGLYYIPVGGFVSIVLTGGMADMNYGDSTAIYTVYQKDDVSHQTRTGITVFNGDEVDWRAGGGLSFAITDGYEVHFITRYQPVSMEGLADYSLSLNFGMNFYF